MFVLRRRPILLTATILAGSILGGSVGSADASTGGVPPCLNYKNVEQYGYVTADTRLQNGDPIGVVSWLWNIDEVTERPGQYAWNIYINGKPATGSNAEGGTVKDDNLHSGFVRLDNGNIRYQYGDTFSMQGLHESPTGKIYLATTNKCYIDKHVY